MSGFYIGIDGKARKVKGGYIGIDGVARKIKKGYIGVDGVARLCYTELSFDPVFANNSWEGVVAACQNNAVPDTWSVGDQMSMNIDGTDYAIDIIGKNHDDYADGSGKAPLTFQLHDCYHGLWTNMHDDPINYISWEGCVMRKTTLPSLMKKLPVEVQNGIKEVTKKTVKGNFSGTIKTTKDKLFLLSEKEISNSPRLGNSREGSQYEYYKTNSKLKYYDGSYSDWWTRSPYDNSSDAFIYVSEDGTTYGADADNNAYISFAFCF